MIKRSTVGSCVLVGGLFFSPVFAEVSLICDFANAANQRAPMHYHWNISNRISPMGSFNMPVGEDPCICVVRPLGGKSRNGKKLIDQDTCKWDGEKYVYDWAPLKKQIDTVLEKARLYQLMIDNPPWAFQRGIDLDGASEVETYGNAWPPNDPKAWSVYIQEMLKELVKTYGKEQVGQWRYCIGREIGTPGHWRASQSDFFEHYRNTENAIRTVLPEAKVGTHFLWASSKNSFGPDFVKWCKQNNVRYDFIGVSYYPFYNKIKRVDPDHVYKVDFAPIKDIPEWNPDATLEIHEFALITSLSKEGNSFKRAPGGHEESFTVLLAKMMYEHDMVDVFRWGTGENKLAEQAFLAMQGNLYYTSSREGAPKVEGNMVDAVFAWDESNSQYNIMVYNYSADPGSKNNEPVSIEMTLPAPSNTEVKYRTASCDGRDLEWSDWRKIRTKAVSGSEDSALELSIQLSTFSFQKIEISAPENAHPASSATRRVLTNRETGKTVEVDLIEVKVVELVCSAKGRRFAIPIASLSDDDQAFLKAWGNERTAE